MTDDEDDLPTSYYKKTAAQTKKQLMGDLDDPGGLIARVGRLHAARR